MSARRGITHPCCESITGRHQSTCALYTPTGKLRLNDLQVDLLLRTDRLMDPNTGLRIEGRALDASASALSRRSFVRLRRYHRHFHVFLTEEGRRLAQILKAEA